jgi:hypothetical protein
MFDKVEDIQENCCMFEWIKNSLESSGVTLVPVPSDLESLKVFIKDFYDDSTNAPESIFVFILLI